MAAARPKSQGHGLPEQPSKRLKLSHPPQSSQSRPHAGPQAGLQRLGGTRPNKRLRPHPPRESRSRHPRGSHSRDTQYSSVLKNATASTLNSGAETPSSDAGSRLPAIKALLDKIWVRNKNQHRSQTWWKSLGMLRKAITTLVVLGEEEQRLRIQHDTATYVDSTQVRRRFEQESQLRREREVWHEWIRETLLPRAYLGFTSLVADTQFAQLGVVLVGVLADVMSVVGAPTASKEDAQATTLPSESKSQAKTLKATSLRVTGVHSGEIVERMYDSDDMGEVIERGDVREGSAIDGDDTRVTKPAGLHIHKPGARGSDDEDDHDDAADEMDQDVNANNTLTVASYEVKVASSSSFPPPETISTTTTRTTDHKSRPMKGAPAVTKGESTTLPSKSRLKTMTSSGNLSTTSSRNPSKAPPPKPASSKLKDKKREKKKTKTNAIDDLFAGLL